MPTVRCNDESRVWLLLLFLLAWALVIPLPAAARGHGCVVTFRHGEAVQADRCVDRGEAFAYERFGGWIVVLKSSLTSIEDELGLTHLFPPLTPAEDRERLRGLPKEGGVPVAPAPGNIPPLPPLVEYVPVPVPVPVPAPPAYEGPAVGGTYAVPIVLCRHCRKPSPRPRVQAPSTPPSGNFPFPTIGPQAVQRSFPPIVPSRSMR